MPEIIRMQLQDKLFPDDIPKIIIENNFNIKPSSRSGETRIKVYGMIDNRVYVVYTMRGSDCRIISARKAKSKEVRHYDNNQKIHQLFPKEG